MPVFSISYDITENSKTNYEKIEKVIETFCNKWCRYAQTSWIVYYSGNADNLAKLIIDTGFGPGDNLLVIKVVNEKQGWLYSEQWEVINSFFNK